MQGNAPWHPAKYSTAWLTSKGLKDEKITTRPSWPCWEPLARLKRQIHSVGKLVWTVSGRLLLHESWSSTEETDRLHERWQLLKRRVAMLLTDLFIYLTCQKCLFVYFLKHSGFYKHFGLTESAVVIIMKVILKNTTCLITVLTV